MLLGREGEWRALPVSPPYDPAVRCRMTQATSLPSPALLDHLEARLQRALENPFAALLAESELRALLRLVACLRAAAQDEEVEAADLSPPADGAGTRECAAAFRRRVAAWSSRLHRCRFVCSPRPSAPPQARLKPPVPPVPLRLLAEAERAAAGATETSGYAGAAPFAGVAGASSSARSRPRAGFAHTAPRWAATLRPRFHEAPAPTHQARAQGPRARAPPAGSPRARRICRGPRPRAPSLRRLWAPPGPRRAECIAPHGHRPRLPARLALWVLYDLCRGQPVAARRARPPRSARTRRHRVALTLLRPHGARARTLLRPHGGWHLDSNDSDRLRWSADAAARARRPASLVAPGRLRACVRGNRRPRERGGRFARGAGAP
jgi:hypothetical protein